MNSIFDTEVMGVAIIRPLFIAEDVYPVVPSSSQPYTALVVGC